MRRIILPFIYILSSLLLHAQDSLTCGFETLFTIKAGMDKAEVMDLVNKNYKVDLVDRRIEKLPPYKKSGGDSITNEILLYKPDTITCFQGRNTLLHLQFADNKLYKAYISTEYPKSAYNDMIKNYNFLRNVIKAKWAHEKAMKLSGGNIEGVGYDYTKTKNATNKTDKTEKISLQYVDIETNNPKTNYLLEVLWANLENTRMEGSNY